MSALAAVLPWIIAGATVYSAVQSGQAAQAAAEERERLRRELSISPEEARAYNALAAQLAWMAGLDPTQFFVQPTDVFAGQTVELPTVPQGTFRAIPQEAIDAALAQVKRDLAQQQAGLSEQALAMAARRGLAGSSLVDQAIANIGAEAARELSRTRTQAELSAEQLTRQYAQQALNMLMGLDPNNLRQVQAATGAFGAIQQQLAAEQAGWGKLFSAGLTLGLAGLEQDPITGQWRWNPRKAFNPFA